MKNTDYTSRREFLKASAILAGSLFLPSGLELITSKASAKESSLISGEYPKNFSFPSAQEKRELELRLEEILGRKIGKVTIYKTEVGLESPVYFVEGVNGMESGDSEVTGLCTEKGVVIFKDSFRKYLEGTWKIARNKFKQSSDKLDIAYDNLIKTELGNVKTPVEVFTPYNLNPDNKDAIIWHTINHEGRHVKDMKNGGERLHKATAYLGGKIGEQREQETGLPVNELVLAEERAYVGNILGLPRKTLALADIVGANSVKVEDNHPVKEATDILLGVYNRKLAEEGIEPYAYHKLSEDEIQKTAIKWAEKYHPDLLR